MYQLIPEERQIVDDVQAGGTVGEKAENGLFRMYAHYVKIGITDHALTEEESLDVYTDTVMSMISAIKNKTYRREAAPGTLMYKMFKNKCVDRFREKTAKKYRVHRTLPVSDIEYQLSDKVKGALEALLLKYDLEELHQKINQLEGNCRELLMLTKNGYPTEEIQEILDLKNRDVVKSRRYNCLEQLRRLYQKKE